MRPEHYSFERVLEEFQIEPRALFELIEEGELVAVPRFEDGVLGLYARQADAIPGLRAAVAAGVSADWREVRLVDPNSRTWTFLAPDRTPAREVLGDLVHGARASSGEPAVGTRSLAEVAGGLGLAPETPLTFEVAGSPWFQNEPDAWDPCAIGFEGPAAEAVRERLAGGALEVVRFARHLSIGTPPDADAAPAGPGGPRRATVRYYSRMAPFACFPLRVEVDDPPADGTPLELVPHLPGCLVVPERIRLDGTAATFHVTPVVAGRLPEASIDVVRAGRFAGRIRIPARSSRQTIAGALLALGVASPLVARSLEEPRLGLFLLPPLVLAAAASWWAHRPRRADVEGSVDLEPAREPAPPVPATPRWN